MDTEKELRQIVADIVELDDPSAITTATSLRSLGIDSMKGLELLLLVEERLGVEVPEEALYGIETFGDMLTYARRAPSR